MRRSLQFALLLAIVIPFGMAVKWGVGNLDQRGLDFGSGIVVGLLLGLALWRWEDRIKERQKRGEYRFWD